MPDTPAARREFRQLKLSDQELQRLKDQIEEDFRSAKSNHDVRIQKFRRIYRMWRGLDVTQGSREDGPDFQVPMIKWVTFGQWARCLQALLGDDAEIVARPQTPVDDKDAVKAGHYMTWRVFEYMQIVPELAAFLFRGILFGRAHCEMIYTQEYYWERDEAGIDREVLCYDGPKMKALWPSQLVVPAQDDVRFVDQFSWKIRRLRIVPQQLLDGERRERYQGITANWDKIIAAAQHRQEREYAWDDEKIDADEADGVSYSSTTGTRDSLEMWQWYGKWRMQNSKRDVGLKSLRYRDKQESDVLVSYLPQVQLIVGVEDLRDLYPRMRKRDPFLDVAMVKDGSYWGPGLGELLEELQNEATINHALFRRAGQFSVGPLVFYKPGGGYDPKTTAYEPFMAIPSENPNDVNVVEMKANLTYSETMSQTLKGFSELVTGLNDQTLGRSIDRPNAPRTAAGQSMLIEQGNVRASLDMTMLRDDMSRLIDYAWQLDREYADEEVFFRVTGDDAGALYDTKNGFGSMTAEEREHSFGFDLKFATSVWSREAKKQGLLQLYQLSLGNPVVAQNAHALWTILNRVWESFGEKNFRDIIPEPPTPETPKTPKEEWLLALKGDEFHVSPLDDDMQHLVDHRRRLQAAMDDDPDRRDPQAEQLMVGHIVEHEQQRRQKMLLQELAQQAVQQMQGMNQGVPMQPGPPMPAPAAGPQPMPTQPAPAQ